MKLTIGFQRNKDIDGIIGEWAGQNGLKEDCASIQIRPDDVAYCFSCDNGESKTFFMINTLDDQICLEAWAIENPCKDDRQRDQINSLLNMLGQPAMSEENQSKIG